jgi:hypothetical protein
MGKAPAFQFYPNDWIRDLDAHSLEIEGAWIRVCCKMWWAPQRGRLTLSLDMWARVLRTTPQEAERIIDYILNEKIGDGKKEYNNYITLISRRMLRDEKDRHNNRLRQRRYQEKKQDNINITDDKQNSNVPSSSSSSSSSSDKDKKAPIELPTKEEIQEASPIKTASDTEDVCKRIYNEKIFPEVFAFKNKMLKAKKNEKAILHALHRCYLLKPDDPWAYCKKILDVEDGNYNERDYQRDSQSRIE